MKLRGAMLNISPVGALVYILVCALAFVFGLHVGFVLKWMGWL